MKSLWLLSLAFTSLQAFAGYRCTDIEFSKKISKGLPAGADSIVSRIIQCNHWGGEVGDTDPERTRQIEEGVKKAKCAELDKDRATFIKQHPTNKKIGSAFSSADTWDGSCE